MPMTRYQTKIWSPWLDWCWCKCSNSWVATKQVPRNLFLLVVRFHTEEEEEACLCSIINTFWNIIYASCSELSKKLGQAGSKIWIKTVKVLFGSITQEPLGLPKSWCYFWVPWTIDNKMHISFFEKMLIILR